MVFNDTAVVYLSRYSPSYVGIEEFLKSYKEFTAGATHTLYILAKGFPNAGSVQVLRNMLNEKELNPEIIEIDDSVGYDLQGYMIAAKIVEENKICFINTFSILKSNNWLLKLKGAFEQNNVGLVGGTGSFESIRNSWEAYLKFQLISNNYKFNSELVKHFYSLSQNLNPNAKQVYDSKFLRIKKYLGDIKHKRPTFNLGRDLDSIDNDVNNIIANHEGFSFIRDFPYFPNPHIRTNFFMVEKNNFILFEKKLLGTPTKMSCSIVESGFESLSRHFLEKGKRLLVVNSDGDFFDIERWVESSTFRLGSQTKLLCTDNRTDEFRAMDDYSKLTHQKFTFGSLLDSINFDVLGVPFKFDKNQIPNVLIDESEETKVSIVIPTRCRESNVLQILKMIKNEKYSNWEIIIFRNNATEPYAPFDEFISDPRIRIFETSLDLPVTDSWNSAIQNASGEYIVLLGDDDGILQGALDHINKLVKNFKRPEAIYSNILQFLHPGSSTIFDSGCVSFAKTCSTLQHINEPFLMNDFQKKELIASSLNFDRPFYFATQPLVFRKDFMDDITSYGKPFKSIFPDYFFSNFIFHKSKNLVLNPKPITFQGVSIKSFGANMMHDKVADGYRNLNIDEYSLHPILVEYLKKSPIILQNSYHLGVADAMIHIADEANDLDSFNFNKFQFNYFQEYFSINRDKEQFTRLLFKFLRKGSFADLFIFCLSFYNRNFESKYFFNITSRYRVKTRTSNLTLDRGSFTSGFEIYNEFKVGKNVL